MSSLPGAVGASPQLLTAVAGARSGAGPLAQALQLGQVYPAQVTALLDGKTEILLGNRYLLAASPFSFSVGDRLLLRLTALEPLLTFQLTLPGAAAAAAGGTDAAAALSSVMRAAGLPDSSASRVAVSLLLSSGLPLTQQSYSDISMLLGQLPAAAVAAFLPFYRELLGRGLRLSTGLLRQTALLSADEQAGAGSIASLLQPARQRQGTRMQGAVAGLAGGGGEPPDADELAALAALLYSSPEAALARAQDAVELDDLLNTGLADAEEDAELLALLTAIRLKAGLSAGGRSFVLPLLLDGEAVALELEHTPLAQEFYQRREHLRLRLRTAEQGPLEVQFQTNGGSLSINILAQDADTLAAYEAELDNLRAEFAGDGGYALRQLTVSAATLDWLAADVADEGSGAGEGADD